MDKKDLRIVFFGTPEFAVESLDLLVTEGFNVVAVVTATDKPAGRGHKLTPSAVKQYAVAHDIPVLQPEKLKNNEFLDELKALNADLFIVIAFRMLPREVWQMPRLGTFNLHASLLPKYRGAAPINHAVINGETRTGVTTFFLSHDIDTGDIIDQEAIDITYTDNAGDVHDKLMHLGAKLTLKTVNDILNGTVKPVPQEKLINAGTEPSPAPKIFREDCRIDWNRSAEEIYNFIRGLAPYPGAWTPLNIDGKVVDVKILKASVDRFCGKPGEVFANNSTGCPQILICTNSETCDCISVESLQIPGKKPMTASDVINGNHRILGPDMATDQKN